MPSQGFELGSARSEERSTATGLARFGDRIRIGCDLNKRSISDMEKGRGKKANLLRGVGVKLGLLAGVQISSANGLLHGFCNFRTSRI